MTEVLHVIIANEKNTRRLGFKINCLQMEKDMPMISTNSFYKLSRIIQCLVPITTTQPNPLNALRCQKRFQAGVKNIYFIFHLELIMNIYAKYLYKY